MKTYHSMSALVIVDPQNDFVLPSGSLSVPDAQSIIPLINELRNHPWDAVVITGDAHPSNHCSFQVNNPGTTLYAPFLLPNGVEQIAWPVHCVAGERGAIFYEGLHLYTDDHIVLKGMDPTKEAYSGFAGTCVQIYDSDASAVVGNIVPSTTTPHSTLENTLRSLCITSVYVCGVATDYCVRATAIDAAHLGFDTHVILDACRGVDGKTTEDAIAKMTGAGVNIIKVTGMGKLKED